MNKLAQRQASVTGFVVGQFLEYFYLCSCMAQHVYKIIDDDIDIITKQVVYIIYQVLSRLVIKYFRV